MEQMTLAQRRDEQIVEAVVVIVAYGNTEAEHGNREPRLTGHVGKRSVVIVVVELQRGRTAVWMAGEVFAVDQDDVRISIVVVVNEPASGTHGLGKPLFTEGAVVVSEVDACLGGDVVEGHDLGVRSGRQENY